MVQVGLPMELVAIDSTNISRIETEAIRVDLSYEDSDNFQKNLVTARIECFEELALLRQRVHSYFTL
jgi:hypothetical protein